MNNEPKVRRCDLFPQYLNYKDEIDQSIMRVLISGRYTLSTEVQSFETEFSAYLGSKYCVGVASATDGIILSLKSIDIGCEDEVITTPFTAIPTVSAIVASGATPVFVDIDPRTYLMDISRTLESITPKTKAIIPVHIFGNVFDVGELKKRLSKNLPIIEDSAQAHGSIIDSQKTGTFGEFGVFSFYPTKNLGAYGDGGAVVMPSAESYQNLCLLRQYGMIDKDHTVRHGYNSRLDELQAAILRVKLKYLDQMNIRRRAIAKVYFDELDGTLIDFQSIPSNVSSNFHVLAGTVCGDREKFVDFLDKKGIQTNLYYPIPLHLQKANEYLGYKAGSLPHAEALCKRIIALPMYPEIPESQLAYTISSIQYFYRNCT
jgi:dTDP-4-amino-4,6-dideoxygalactose transaminase